jgi:hypothetical protein
MVVVVPVVVAIGAWTPRTAEGLSALFERQGRFDDVHRELHRGHRVPGTVRVQLEAGERRVIAVDVDYFDDNEHDVADYAWTERQVRVRVTDSDGDRIDTGRPHDLRDTFATSGTTFMPVRTMEAPHDGTYRVRMTARDHEDDGEFRVSTFPPLDIDDWAIRLATIGNFAAVALFVLLWRRWRRTRRQPAS